MVHFLKSKTLNSLFFWNKSISHVVNFGKSHSLCANLSHLGSLLLADFVPIEGMLSMSMLASRTTGDGGRGRSTACEITSGARGAGTCESGGLVTKNFMMKQQAHGLNSHHQISIIR